MRFFAVALFNVLRAELQCAADGSPGSGGCGMRAVRAEKLGAPLVLTAAPQPVPSAGVVLIQNTFAGINFIDTLVPGSPFVSALLEHRERKRVST